MPAIVAGVARIVVIADFLFTATAVVAQPITGVLLAWTVGYSLLTAGSRSPSRSISSPARSGCPWCGCRCACAISPSPPCARAALPPEYHRLFRLWFAFGFPAFAAVLAIFWLMIAKPPLG